MDPSEYTDSGMGWRAKTEYMIQPAGVTLANLQSISGAIKLPIATNDATLYSNGLKVGSYISQATGHTISIYYGVAQGNTVYLSYVTSEALLTCISQTRNVLVYFMLWDEDAGSVGTSTQTFSIWNSRDYPPWYFGVQSYNRFTLSPAVPSPYSTVTQMCQNIVVTNSPITKDNAGYAVACVVKWKTQNGTVLQSPILISSESEYTDMSGASGYNIATFNMLLSGVRFYMSFWDIPQSEMLSPISTFIDLSGESNLNLTLEQLFMTIISTSYAHVIIINSPDPYETEGGDSKEEGGDGEETGDDDAGIEAGSDFPSAINTGFCRIFSPSESELRDLSNYLWSSSYDLEQVKKLFSNPMDSILGLSAVPIRLLGSSVSFSLGGVPITGMTLPLVTQQRYTYHMGSITIKERWGSYLDYDPYTKFSIFLPFIGMRELAADDIMGKTVSLVYDIDILTGMCVARLQAGTNCLYEWGGNCAIQLPVNSRNWDSVFSTAVSAVGGIVSAVTGGSAPLVAGSVASAALQTVSMKPRIDKSSTIGGAAGWLGQMTPYIIRTTPEAFIPTDQNKFIGYPAYINVALDSISGYNEVESIHLENVTATGAELEEIESILKGGVIY